jgi:hypothetical protein
MLYSSNMNSIDGQILKGLELLAETRGRLGLPPFPDTNTNSWTNFIEVFEAVLEVLPTEHERVAANPNWNYCGIDCLTRWSTQKPGRVCATSGHSCPGSTRGYYLELKPPQSPPPVEDPAPNRRRFRL